MNPMESMSKRCFVSFSVRLEATEPISRVAARVQDALGCPLERGDYQGLPALVGDLLGIRVGLLRWRGLEGAHVYQLHGLPDTEQLQGTEWEQIHIEDAIIDLLRVRGAGAWRKPLPGELMAESAYDPEDI
jgi:hypothetical protein